MNVLENELVKKYFHDTGFSWIYANKVIEAMHQPIVKGERCLRIEMPLLANLPFLEFALHDLVKVARGMK